MESNYSMKTPYFLVDEELLENNLRILKRVSDETGCHILLAQKCFSMFRVYPLIGQYLCGTTASGLHEARLGKEYMGKENHVFAAAFRDDEIDEILELCDHVIFNSFSQWKRYKEKCRRAGKEIGLRVNPVCSTQEGHEIYDPCAPYSRMGITKEKFQGEDLTGISGLHFHTLCEQNSDALKTTLAAVEEQFGDILPQMKWVNFGGGHHITRQDYDIETLISCIRHIQNKYQVQVYLEPGEAVALQAGFLKTSVLDIINNDCEIAILDASAACHMPDVLEMPYTPEVIGARIVSRTDATCTENDKGAMKTVFRYRLAGPTCLAGDVIGDYEFDHPLEVGEQLTFCDMAIYSMVKTNTFNGMNLPSIVLLPKGEAHREPELIRSFGYNDFKNRLS